MNLGELFVQIGAIGNSKEVKAFGNAVKKAGDAIDKYDRKFNKAKESANNTTFALKGTIGAIVGVATAAAGAYWALDKLTDSLVKQNIQWLNLTRQSDIALATFQKWGTIGKIVGVENAAQQIESLNQKIFNLKLTGEGAKGFQMAGIMPTNADDVLEQLRHRIKGMSNTSASYLLQQMGLDPKMITLLRMGRDEWEKYLDIQRRFTLTDTQREKIDQMNRQLEVARIKVQYLKDRAILALMPEFVRLTKFLISVTEAFARLVNWVIKAESPFAIIIKSILGIVAALKLLNLVLASNPIVALIMGIIGSIMLLADDINHFLNGGDSLIGTIVNGLKDLNIGGFLDFPMPKWLEALIKVIDFTNGGGWNTIPEALKSKIGEIKDLSGEIKGKFHQIAPVSSYTKSVIDNSSTHTESNTSSVSQQITVYTSADTIRDIAQPIYLRAQALS